MVSTHRLNNSCFAIQKMYLFSRNPPENLVFSYYGTSVRVASRYSQPIVGGVSFLLEGFSIDNLQEDFCLVLELKAEISSYSSF